MVKGKNMGIWFWFVLAIIGFAFITIVRKWHDYSMLFTIAIGFAINANIFYALSAPMYLGPIVLSIDSILYTGFMFCVVVCAIEYGVRKAKILTSASIAAILLSAVIEFLAKVSTVGFDIDYLVGLSSYIFSAIGTFAGVWLMLFILEKLQNKNVNVYLNITICILISSIINSTIFYGFTILVSGVIDNIGYIICGSYIGKVICIALGLLSYFISTHYFIPNDLKEKYQKPKKQDQIEEQ